MVADDAIGGTLYCHLGDVTNLAVARGPYCVFSRLLGFGMEGIAQSLAASSGLNLEHARQWLIHVGLDAPVDELEGDPQVLAHSREALASGRGDASSTSCAARSSTTRRSRTRFASMISSSRAQASRSPASSTGSSASSRLPVRAAVPEPLRGAAGAAAGRLTLSYGLGLEE